jgi:hypothetical protein
VRVQVAEEEVGGDDVDAGDDQRGSGAFVGGTAGPAVDGAGRFTARSSRHPGIGDLLPRIGRDLTATFWG